MTEHAAQDEGDFVRIASCSTPTEAHLLKGVLESAGLAAQVADANLVQAHSWLTPAVGGVRVLVPASQVRAAREVVTEFESGALELPDEDAAAPAISELTSPVFSPDLAVLFSFLLTPAFGAAIQLANASILGREAQERGRWVGLCVLAVISILGIGLAHAVSPGPLVAFRASFFLSLVTVVWYLGTGQLQSRTLLASHGARYPRRSLALPAMGTAIALLSLGWVLSEIG